MRFLISLVVLLSVAGCSSARLKRCESRAIDPSLQTCGDPVDASKKEFRMCEKPVNLFICEDPR